MKTHSIPKKQEKTIEMERRNCLARHLIHCDPEHQKTFLKNIKSDCFREDMKERMRYQLALEISKMDDNIRKLRLARLFQRCQRNSFSQSFFKDITSRVNQLLLAEESANG